MAAYEILPAGIGDLKELRRLEDECFLDDAWATWDLIYTLLVPGVIRYKAWLDGHMVGFISADNNWFERLGWITTLGVSEKFRRQGIGMALLKQAQSRISLPCVRLCVRHSNIPAQHLYRKSGYREIGIWRNYYNDGENAMVMEFCKAIP